MYRYSLLPELCAGISREMSHKTKHFHFLKLPILMVGVISGFSYINVVYAACTFYPHTASGLKSDMLRVRTLNGTVGHYRCGGGNCVQGDWVVDVIAGKSYICTSDGTKWDGGAIPNCTSNPNTEKYILQSSADSRKTLFSGREKSSSSEHFTTKRSDNCYAYECINGTVPSADRTKCVCKNGENKTSGLCMGKVHATFCELKCINENWQVTKIKTCEPHYTPNTSATECIEAQSTNRTSSGGNTSSTGVTPTPSTTTSPYQYDHLIGQQCQNPVRLPEHATNGFIIENRQALHGIACMVTACQQPDWMVNPQGRANCIRNTTTTTPTTTTTSTETNTSDATTPSTAIPIADTTTEQPVVAEETSDDAAEASVATPVVTEQTPEPCEDTNQGIQSGHIVNGICVPESCVTPGWTLINGKCVHADGIDCKDTMYMADTATYQNGVCTVHECYAGFEVKENQCVEISGPCKSLPDKATRGHRKYDKDADSVKCNVDDCVDGYVIADDKMSCREDYEALAEQAREREQSTGNK